MFIKIISYNILADYYSDPDYILVNKKYLNNAYRIKLLIKKLSKEFNSKYTNIFCLQEISPTQMSKLYIYFKKKDYYCINAGDLAIFFPSKLILKKLEMDLISGIKNSYNNSHLINQQKHKYIISTFCYNNKSFTVCNTHLVSSPELSNIKTLQGYLITNRLSKYKNILFCGDFNSKPDSNLYNLLSKGGVGKLISKVNLKSSYKSFYGSEPNATTHASNKATKVFTETIDYIWVEKKIEIINVRKLWSYDRLKNNDFLPDKNNPSDHLLLSIVVRI